MYIRELNIIICLKDLDIDFFRRCFEWTLHQEWKLFTVADFVVLNFSCLASLLKNETRAFHSFMEQVDHVIWRSRTLQWVVNQSEHEIYY